MIEFVFLDLDDTLLDFGASERAAISEVLSHYGFMPTEKLTRRYSEINDLEWKRLERGEASRDVILTERFEIFFTELGAPVNPREVRALYESTLAKFAFLIEGARELLDALSGKYRLFITSNGTAEVANSRINIAGIREYFEKIFISSEIGAAKPSREFFDAAFAKIDAFSRERAIIIGDSLTSDILGGINAGIKTCLYSDKENITGAIVPDYKIKSLGELPNLLEKL